MNASRNTGFTLIEILIVVTLIAVLAAIAIPNYTDASDTAKGATYATDIQTLRGQVQLYKAKTGSFPATLDALIPDYMPTVPLNVATGNAYAYDATTGAVAP